MIKYIIRKANNYTNGIGDNRFILWFNWHFILKHTKPIKLHIEEVKNRKGNYDNM